MICRYKIKFISDIEQKIRKLLVNIAVAPFVGVWIEILEILLRLNGISVAPFVGVWIEMYSMPTVIHQLIVAPFVGVWIEINHRWKRLCYSRSLPLWECGLKSAYLPSSVNVGTGRSLCGSVD